MTATACLVIVRVVLIPVDLLLRLIGPRYRPYFWFFTITPPAVVARIGRLRAIRAADHARRKVPAYQAFLRSRGCAIDDVARLSLPETDKGNYVKVHRPAERCVNGKLPTRGVAIDESSGSSGTPFNWVRSLEERQASHYFISHFARYAFGEEPWITINAFSMGTWATGVNIGIALQRNSVVKNTGPDLDKIFGTLAYFGPQHRYLVCGYPPFLKRVIDAARERGFPLRDYQLMALLGGEGNSEGVRDYLYEAFRPVYSGYGATDIEIGLAGETPVSLAIRRAARDDAHLRTALFGSDSRLPMVFQYNPLMHYVERTGRGELVFTISRLNVLAPRIRYNIQDEGGIATFSEMGRRFEQAGRDLHSLVFNSGAQAVRMPFVWVYGRKDSTVSVMGANVYPEDIEECIYSEPELARTANSYCIGLEEVDATTRASISIEVREEPTPQLRRRFEDLLTNRLAEINADFREALREYPEAASPVVALYPLGRGPFARDAMKIKQTRIIRSEGPPVGMTDSQPK